jgi:uroporphyrin-III C-methyltransferase/precorrin-2 dehydrogenase/sirohydrochlorin ferrochelatase
MTELLPLFLNLAGRRVVLVGGGRVAAAKLQQLIAVDAQVTVVAPQVHDDITRAAARAADARRAIALVLRPFESADLDEAWLVVAAATPTVNRAVRDAADARRIFVNAVDDPPHATAFSSGVVRRDGVTIAISTNGEAPALTALVREGLDALLPRDLAAWIRIARAERVEWKRRGVPIEERKPRLLRALNAAYANAPRVPWLHAPEDSWL